MNQAVTQLPLFGRREPAFDPSFAGLKRTDLGQGAWIEFERGWLEGHARLFDELGRELPWYTEKRYMYERMVDVPRLQADSIRHPLIERMREVLSRRYATKFRYVTAAFYRSGDDSIAWHSDREVLHLPKALVATVSVGSPRRFLLRPITGGRSTALTLGWGDLLVMGGTCQLTYQHAIPKVAHAEPRIAIMFRP